MPLALIEDRAISDPATFCYIRIDFDDFTYKFKVLSASAEQVFEMDINPMMRQAMTASVSNQTM